MMQTTIQIDNKPVNVLLTKAAEKALVQLQQPLVAEMELYFSCLIRTKVRFYKNRQDTNAVPVNDKLQVRFRPVMTKSCSRDYEGDEPPLTDFPIANSRPFIPKWLRIDYKNSHWQGEFGFQDKKKRP